MEIFVYWPLLLIMAGALILVFSMFTESILAVALSAVLIITGINNVPDEEVTGELVTPLYTLQNHTNISGAFFLGTGSINQTNGYIAFIEKDGGLVKFLMPETSIIYQTDEVSPRFVENECQQFNKVQPCSNSNPRIFIPKGSIIQKYNLN